MCRRRPFVVVMQAAGFLVVTHIASAAECESALPANINPGLFRREMVRLLERSQTFRAQCRRIASAPYTRVRFDVGFTLPPDARAETVIERFDAGALIASVVLRFSEDYMELIPHELEHVIEQIDRVRLSDESRAHRAWEHESGAFETRRAVMAGRRVRGELDASVVKPAQRDGRQPVPLRHSFQ